MRKDTERARNISDIALAIDTIPEHKKGLAEKLYKRVKFMDRTLNALEKTIKKEGAVITAINGNGFETVSEHPAQKSYNIMIGKYNALVKTILDLIPNDNSQGDELIEFLSGGKT